MIEDVLLKAIMASQQGSHYCFATIVEATIKGTPRKAGAKMIVFDDGSSWGTIGGGRNEKAAIAECLEAIKTGKPKNVTYNYFGREGESVCGGKMTVFIEPVKPSYQLIICGAGHIALPLSLLAKMLSFKVTIIDNRKQFANTKRFPHVDKVICGEHAKELSKIKITPQVYVAIVTQGNESDYECLKTVIKSNAGYIGVISSQPKKVKFFKRLKDEGIKESYLSKVSIPMGIDIGSQTPEEIGISICAELIRLKNKELLGTSKFKK